MPQDIPFGYTYTEKKIMPERKLYNEVVFI